MCVCVCVWLVEGESEGRLTQGYMVDGLHIPIWTRTKKPLTIALGRKGRGFRGRDNGDDVPNEQYKPNKNCHYESPLYNE
jgi:hypothetical protein